MYAFLSLVGPRFRDAFKDPNSYLAVEPIFEVYYRFIMGRIIVICQALSLLVLVKCMKLPLHDCIFLCAHLIGHKYSKSLTTTIFCFIGNRKSDTL